MPSVLTAQLFYIYCLALELDRLTVCSKSSNNAAQPLQCVSYHIHTLILPLFIGHRHGCVEAADARLDFIGTV